VVIRRPATDVAGRVGSLFLNPGGPGVSGVALVPSHATSTFAARRVRRNRGILPYLSTANVVRDLDSLRAAVGDSKLTYLGVSYGTLLGATVHLRGADPERAFDWLVKRLDGTPAFVGASHLRSCSKLPRREPGAEMTSIPR
jgi:pimeloyl-ACP methyl ester carboxylesterase